MSLTQLVGTLYYICKGPKFELRSSHLSTLRVEFLAIRLLDKKKEETIVITNVLCMYQRSKFMMSKLFLSKEKNDDQIVTTKWGLINIYSTSRFVSNFI
jgi:hypothetical protein